MCVEFQMADRGNVNDECSRAMITSIDHIDEWGYSIMNPTNVGFNELEAEPIVKEEGGEVRSTSTKIPRKLNQMVFILAGYLEKKRNHTIPIIYIR